MLLNESCTAVVKCGETGSVWAAVETLGEATVAVETTVGLEELEESVETAVGTDTGTGGTTGNVARTGAGAGSNCCTCGTLGS